MSAARRACRAPVLAACAILLASCAAHPDRFYGLSTLPGAALPPAAGYATRILLSTSIPSVVDRRELIVDAPGDQVLVLEHERWAAPLSDLVNQTLARDIEQRRADVLVADRAFDRAGIKPVRIRVEIVQMSARRGGQATLGGALENRGRRGATRSARRRQLFFADRGGRLRLDSPRLQPMPGVARRPTGREAALTVSRTGTIPPRAPRRRWAGVAARLLQRWVGLNL